MKTTTLTQTVVLLAALIVLAAFPCLPARAQNVTFHANGFFMQGGQCSTTGSLEVCINMSVYGYGSNQSEPLLSYFLQLYDLVSTVDNIFSGYGTIPTAAVQVKGRGIASLNIDTSSVPGFQNYLCTFTPSGSSCGPAPGGVVSADLKAVLGLHYSVHTTGTTIYSLPNYRMISTGTTDQLDAVGILSVFGVAEPNVTGIMGTSHNTNITVQRQ